jgi:hypothetical protein
VNRRSFAESVALAALAPALGLGIEPARAGSLPRPVRSIPASERNRDGENRAALAGALAGMLRARYPGRLEGEQLAAVMHEIHAGLDRADLIRRADQGRGH